MINSSLSPYQWLFRLCDTDLLSRWQQWLLRILRIFTDRLVEDTLDLKLTVQIEYPRISSWVILDNFYFVKPAPPCFSTYYFHMKMKNIWWWQFRIPNPYDNVVGAGGALLLLLSLKEVRHFPSRREDQYVIFSIIDAQIERVQTGDPLSLIVMLLKALNHRESSALYVAYIL